MFPRIDGSYENPSVVRSNSIENCCVEDFVAPKIEEIAVKFVPARFQGDVDHAAAKRSVSRVIGVGHDLELTHRFGVGRNLPGPPLVADRRAVQEKEILSGPGAVDSERVVYVPAARA